MVKVMVDGTLSPHLSSDSILSHLIMEFGGYQISIFWKSFLETGV